MSPLQMQLILFIDNKSLSFNAKAERGQRSTYSIYLSNILTVEIGLPCHLTQRQEILSLERIK